MAKNKTELDGILEKMALIAEGIQDIFQESKSLVILELNKKDFKDLQDNFRDIDKQHNKFNIEISNVDFIIVDKEANQKQVEENIKKKSKKFKIQQFLKKIKNYFK